MIPQEDFRTETIIYTHSIMEKIRDWKSIKKDLQVFTWKKCMYIKIRKN